MHRPRALPRDIVRCLLVLLPISACSDPLDPRDVAGTYVLRSVQGEPLPTVLWASPGYRADILADTLRLDADGQGEQVRLFAAAEPPGSSGPTRWERPLAYRLKGHTLTGTYLCPRASACLTVVMEEFAGTVTRGRLQMDRALGARVPLEYERVGP